MSARPGEKTEERGNTMKRFVMVCTLALAVMALSQQKASAWKKFGFNIGLNLNMELADNSTLCAYPQWSGPRLARSRPGLDHYLEQAGQRERLPRRRVQPPLRSGRLRPGSLAGPVAGPGPFADAPGFAARSGSDVLSGCLLGPC